MKKDIQKPVGKIREKQKQQTYAQILESARMIFDQEGYEKTTMRAVACHAEIGLGTIYKHFPNKISLLAAAFYDDLSRMNKGVFKTLPDGVPIRQQLLHIAERFYTYYTQNPALSTTYVRNLFFIEDQMMERINTFDERFIQKIKDLMEQAQQRGEISVDKNSQYLALSFYSNYLIVLGTFFIRLKTNDLDAMLELLGNLIDQSVC